MPRLMRLKEGGAMSGVGRRGYGSRVGGCRHRMLKISGRFELGVGYLSECYHGRPTTSEASERFTGLRFGLADEVSILITLIGAVGRCPGVAPGSKISMMIMRPPQ